MDPMWMIMLMMQQQEADRRRQQEEAAARAKAEADAQAAKQAEMTRQQQIAQQRQQEAAAAKTAEDERLAAVANRPGPVAPADQYSPVGGTFFGANATHNQARPVGQILAPQQPLAKKAPTSPLGDMFGAAAQPQATPQQMMSQRQVGGQAPQGGAGYRIF